MLKNNNNKKEITSVVLQGFLFVFYCFGEPHLGSSGLTLGPVFRDNSWWYLEEHMWYWGLDPH